MKSAIFLKSFFILFLIFSMAVCAPNLDRQDSLSSLLGYFNRNSQSSSSGSGSLEAYSLSVSVSGLLGSGLVLQNNNQDRLQIATDGAYTFPSKIPSGNTYQVSILVRPQLPNQSCAVSNGEGVVTRENIDNVLVTCSSEYYTVSFSLEDMENSGIYTLTANLNGKESKSVSHNGTYDFQQKAGSLEGYNVSLETLPLQHQCKFIGENSSNKINSNQTVRINCFSVLSPDFSNIISQSWTNSIDFVFSTSVSSQCNAMGLAKIGSQNWKSAKELELLPLNSWNLGSQIVTLDKCNSETTGNPLTQTEWKFVFQKAPIYVSSNGNFSNCSPVLNSPTTTCNSIAAAFSNFSSLCSSQECSVLVEEGTYTESVSIPPNFSLFGSYKAGSNFSDRLPTNHSSVILGQSAGCGTEASNPCIALSFVSGTGKPTVDGFAIYSASGQSFSETVRLSSDIIFQNNLVVSQSMSGTNGISIGIALNGGKAELYKNTIRASDSSGDGAKQYGIWVGSNTAPYIISGNWIQGGSISGTNTESYGFYIEGANPNAEILISSNYITAGQASISVGVAQDAVGSLNFYLIGNDIAGGNATEQSIGILLTGSGSSYLSNNQIWTSNSAIENFCIWNDKGKVTSVENNNVFHCDQALYNDSGTLLDEICINLSDLGNFAQDTSCTTNPLTKPKSFLNQSIDAFSQTVFRNIVTVPLDLRLLSSTPCLITNGAANPPTFVPVNAGQTAAIYKDYDGLNRLVNGSISIGMYDWDGSCQ